MGDWEEIKRLAADFQRTQTSETLQRISDRNCIDILKKLTELSLIELIYTCDGKQFVTPSHLLKEIEDDIYYNGGRMHLHELAADLNVDYQHVENRAKELLRDKPDEYSLILGQIIHTSYKKTLGKQINDSMIINGQLSIAEFSKSIDLPSEFLLTIVKELMPKLMDDYVVSADERTYYTLDSMNRYRSIIAGTLSAILKPVSVATLMKRLDIPERIFSPILDSLIKEGRIDAIVESRQFIPAIYAREQNSYIEKFYSSNLYIEYDVLARMDIKQPKSLLKKKYPDSLPLKTCIVSPDLVSQLESHIEDSIASSSYIDASTILPPSIQVEDIDMIIKHIFKQNNQFDKSCRIFNQTVICSTSFVEACRQSLESLMNSKAEEQLKQGKLMEHFMGKSLPSDRSRTNSEHQTHSDKAPQDHSKENATPKRQQESTSDFQTPDNKPKENIPKSDAVREDEVEREDKRSKKKDRKSKHEERDAFDSDDDLDPKKSKGSRRSGGFQGRESKSKSVKKKYVPGLKNTKTNESSDEESSQPTKGSRSNKGRAARRAASPDRPSSGTKSNKTSERTKTVPTPVKEPLIFMDMSEITQKLKYKIEGADIGVEEFLEQLAQDLKDDLDVKYEKVARQCLDTYLKSQTEESSNPNDPNAQEIELIE